MPEKGKGGVEKPAPILFSLSLFSPAEPYGFREISAPDVLRSYGESELLDD
jgi:hypothetical protein